MEMVSPPPFDPLMRAISVGIEWASVATAAAACQHGPMHGTCLGCCSSNELGNLIF